MEIITIEITKLQQALDLLCEVEKDLWLLNWSEEQLQDFNEASNRLAWLLESLGRPQTQPVHQADVKTAEMLIEACRQAS
ncbi:MAG: hypothetical protein F6K24_31090 [Okeania sp. SIO2D1]|nr:hypothetical protein [Okeania sp. SIO2D1]